MVNQRCLVASILSAHVACAKPVTRKRGTAGFISKNFACNDAELLGLMDSWYYDWIGNPSQYNRCKGKNISAEFVPMVSGVKGIKALDTDHFRREWAELNAQFLLGYNEPDYGNGHNHPHMVSAAEGAAAWPQVQKIAAAASLVLVSPSVASSAESGGGDAWDENGRSLWMDWFLGNCSKVVKECDPSLIKYIGMHDYHGDVDMLRKKVWLTEIAITDWRDAPGRDKQDAYMKKLLPYLDSSENVFRYSWFSTRNKPNKQNGGSNLLAEDGSATLTSTGHIYKDTPDGSAANAVIV